MLELTEAEQQLYHQGVREMDSEEGLVPEVIRTCMAYTGAIGVNGAKEAACLNDRVGCFGQGS